MEKIKKFFSSIAEKVEKFIDDVVGKVKKFVDDAKSQGLVETVRKVTTSNGSSYGMKAWMLFDFGMDLMIFGTAWWVLSWPLQLWTLVIVTAHLYMIVREFMIAPLHVHRKEKDGEVVRGHFSFMKDSDVVIDHE